MINLKIGISTQNARIRSDAEHIVGGNGGRNWRLELEVGTEVGMEVGTGPWIREVGIEVGMEVWEGSLHCLDEITLQISITTCAIVESD